ncbi:unnamed protein product [Lupinus luteus]|uniref:Uncharacterized protein n=1 Tax=Lupinus luteus TaxID=3873 RepID=A0AAV1WTM0_LUPLU
MGLTVHVFSQNETVEIGLVSKMNFVVLAGYEDARKKSIDVSCHAEINKINKCIYALLNDNSLLEAVNHASPNPGAKNDNSLPDASSNVKLNVVVEEAMT